MKEVAVLTGGNNGLLGPVWKEVLEERGYDVRVFDLPQWNMLKVADIARFCMGLPPTVIVHNAAIDPKPGQDDGQDAFRRHKDIMTVNHMHAVEINNIFIPHMIDNGGGVIIHIGSIMGYIAANQDNYTDGWTKAFGYNESKAATMSHVHSLNKTFGKQGIRAVMPSFGPFEKGLSPDFMEGFGKKIPVNHPVSEEDLKLTLNYCLDCQSLAGEFRVDGGYTRVGA